MAGVRLECPAKINLFLSVGPPDRSGYHPIRTVFQAISLSDMMEIRLADSDSFHVTGAGLPEENTVTKAWRLMREVATLPRLSVKLVKRIPTMAGLGGGSSDAGAFIRGVAALLTPRPVQSELLAVAAAVGADVPFCVVGGKARGEGYGERLELLGDPPPQWIVVLKPPVSCATPDMYRRLDAVPREWLNFTDDMYNDFERVAPCECLEAIERLKVHGASAAGLSGSGSAVFGLFASREAAETAREALGSENLGQTWVARTLTRSESLSFTRL